LELGEGAMRLVRIDLTGGAWPINPIYKIPISLRDSPSRFFMPVARFQEASKTTGVFSCSKSP
jgi:hypothetical protein